MPWRNFFRWLALVGGLAILLWRAPHALRDYRDWREAAVIDPSAAELYETDLWFEAAGVTVALGLGLLIFFSLRRKPIGGPSGDSSLR
jgi:hypothetical protein